MDPTAAAQGSTISSGFSRYTQNIGGRGRRWSIDSSLSLPTEAPALNIWGRLSIRTREIEGSQLFLLRGKSSGEKKEILRTWNAWAVILCKARACFWDTAGMNVECVEFFFSLALRVCAFFVIKDVRRMVGRGGKKAENRGEREREERKLGEIADLT